MPEKWHKTSLRTVKCPRCKVRRFYVFENEDGATELRDAISGERHSCATRPQAATQNPIGPAITRGTDDELAELSKHIPSRSQLDTYVPRRVNGHTDLDVMVAAYRKNAAHMAGSHLPECEKTCRMRPVNVLLISETQAGKNHLIRAMCAKIGVPYVRYNFNAGVTIDGMFGKYLLPEAGRTVWQDGTLTLAARHGAVICLDEINACPNEIAIALHPMLDAERLAIVSDKPDVFHLAPTAFFVGTMNPDYAGTRPLNPAFKARFELLLTLDYDPDVEKKLIPDANLLKLAAALRTIYRTGDGTVNTPVSTGLLLSYISNRATLGEEIARESFLSSFDTKEEKNAVRESYLAFMEQGKTDEIDVEKDVNLDEQPAP